MVISFCKPLIHIIMFKLKEPSLENIIFMKETLAKLHEIEFVKALQIVVDEDRAEYSYDFTMILKFSSVEDIEKYLIHPIHKDDVVAKTTPYIQSVAVIDLSAEEALLENEFGVYRQIILFTLHEPVQENLQILSGVLEDLRVIPYITKLVVVPNIVSSARNSDMVLFIDVENKGQMTKFINPPVYIQSIMPKTLQYVKKLAAVSYLTKTR